MFLIISRFWNSNLPIQQKLRCLRQFHPIVHTKTLVLTTGIKTLQETIQKYQFPLKQKIASKTLFVLFCKRFFLIKIIN